jgi:ectoine hydroxylase-related dioxygenase (phytanoyl-CoA dioxygenase family)
MRVVDAGPLFWCQIENWAKMCRDRRLSEEPGMNASDLKRHLEAIEEDGYTILENIASPELVSTLTKRVRQVESETAGSREELAKDPDHSFLRTAGLLRIDPLFHQVPIQADVCQVVEGVLGEGFLLSTFSALDIEPHKSNMQPLHPDDALIPVPRPHVRPIGCTCMWVLTPFNQDTGGTRLIPGSQRAPLDLLFNQDSEEMKKTIQPDVSPGSVLVFDHALFHGAADNHTEEWRLGLQVSYHTSWIRPYTNWFKSIPEEEVGEFPERLAHLLGHKIYSRGIGSSTREMGSYREGYGQIRKMVESRPASE